MREPNARRRSTIWVVALIAIAALIATACQAETTVTVAPDLVEAAAQPDPTAVTAAPPTAVPPTEPTSVATDEPAEPTPVPRVTAPTPAPDEPTSTPLPTPTPIPAGATDAEPPPLTAEPSCSFSRLDGFGDIQVFIDLIGSSDAANPVDVTVEYELLTGGEAFGEGTEVIAGVGPGEMIRIEDDSLDDAPEDGSDPAESVDCVVTDVRTDPNTTIAGIDWSCSFLALDEFGDARLELDVDTGDAFSSAEPPVTVQYAIALRQADGLRVETLFRELGGVVGDQPMRLEIETFGVSELALESGLGCEVVSAEEGNFTTPEVPPSDASCRVVEVDGFGDVQVEYSMTFPDGDNTVVLWTALVDPDGVWIGNVSTFHYSEDYNPGQTNVIQSDTYTELPPWVTESQASCEVVAIEQY